MESSINPITAGLPGLMGGKPQLPSGKGKDLENASADFVGLLFGYVFSQMRNNEDADENSLFGGDNSQMFMGFLDQEMGKQMARSEGQGLAKQLFWELGKAQGLKPGKSR